MTNDTYLPHKRGLYIAHLNICSLFPSYEEIKVFISSSRIAIAVITESWLSQSVSDSQIAIPGYQIIRFDREGRGGGIMVYILDGFTFDLT